MAVGIVDIGMLLLSTMGKTCGSGAAAEIAGDAGGAVCNGVNIECELDKGGLGLEAVVVCNCAC